MEMATHYAVQYRWPGNEWNIYNRTAEQMTIEGAIDEMESMKKREVYDFPLDTIRMEYRIISIQYNVIG